MGRTGPRVLKRPRPESDSSSDQGSSRHTIKRPSYQQQATETSSVADDSLLDGLLTENDPLEGVFDEDDSDEYDPVEDVDDFNDDDDDSIVFETMAADDFEYLPDQGQRQKGKTRHEPWSPQTLCLVAEQEPPQVYLVLDDLTVDGAFCDSVASWISLLCSRTGTDTVADVTRQGLTANLQTICNRQLSLEAHVEPTVQVKMAVVVTWLAACFRFHVKNREPQNRASLTCKTLLHAAIFVVKELAGEERPSERLSLKRDLCLEGYVTYWETRVTSSDRSMFRDWLSTLSLTTELFPDTRSDDTTTSFLHIQKDEGIMALAEMLIQMESEGEKTILRKQLEKRPQLVLRCLIKLLVSIQPETMESIIWGNVLNRSLREGDAVQKDLAVIRQDENAAIYANIFADGAGVPPLAIHWQQWAIDCDCYITEPSSRDDAVEEWAESVDTVWYPLPHRHVSGHRRYCDSWKRFAEGPDGLTRRHGKKARENIHLFQSKILERAQAACRDGKALQPLQCPPCNVGYSRRPIDRLGQHERHEKSNYIMNLTEALFMRRYNDHFRVHQRPLYTCREFIQSWLGEIALSQLMQCYVFNGGGFSHCHAGFSNHSMFRSGSAEEEYWAQRGAEARRATVEALHTETEAEIKRRDLARVKAAHDASPELRKLSSFLEDLKATSKRILELNRLVEHHPPL